MLKIGKLPNEMLQGIVLRHIKHRRPEVKVRPGVGEDCAVIDFGEADCVMSTDPITASGTGAGSLAVHVSCNDIASNGVAPLGIMLTLMLPVGTSEKDVETLMRDAAAAADELGVEIIGGHTEITPAVNKPVIVSTAIGKSAKKNHPDHYGRKAVPGDAVMLTKSAGLEGTGILASDHEGELRGALSDAELDEAKNMLSKASVVKEGVIAGGIGFAAMHDVTEGGVLGALWEICQVSGVGALVNEGDIPVAAVTKKICAYFKLDALKLISSGAMLIVADPQESGEIRAALDDAGVSAAVIGEIRPKGEGIILEAADGSVRTVEAPGADEIYKVELKH